MRQGLAEIRSTTAISLYLEIDFHDNTSIAMWIINNVKPIDEAICKGVCNYFGVLYKPQNQTPNEKLYRVQIGGFQRKKLMLKIVWVKRENRVFR